MLPMLLLWLTTLLRWSLDRRPLLAAAEMDKSRSPPTTTLPEGGAEGAAEEAEAEAEAGGGKKSSASPKPRFYRTNCMVLKCKFVRISAFAKL